MANETQQSNEKQNDRHINRIWLPLGLLIILVILIGGYFLRSEIKARIRLAPTDVNKPPTCTQIGQTWTSPKSGATLVCVPGGVFTMGAGEDVTDALPREKPQHTVNLNPFWIDQTEVTNAMFNKFVEATGFKTWAETKRNGSYVYNPDSSAIWDDRVGAKWNAPEGPGSNLIGKENLPVVHVHRDDAERYCKWSGGRLPTEAEWEKAARGTDGRLYPWGNEAPEGQRANLADRNLPEVAWTDPSLDDGYRFTAPVGTYPLGASPYGALDMAGNVWEIVADWADWNYYPISPVDNPTGPEKGADKVLPVIRGGSWYGNAWEARSFHRTMPDPNKSSVVVGFRCVIDHTTFVSTQRK